MFDVDSIGLTNVVDPAQPRPRRRRPADRRADGVPRRRHGQSGGGRPRRGAAAVRVQGRGRRRVRGDAAGLRRRAHSSGSSSGSTRFRMPIVAGVWPFESARNAEFMANEVPGVSVPDALVERMRAGATARCGGATEGSRLRGSWPASCDRWCRAAGVDPVRPARPGAADSRRARGRVTSRDPVQGSRRDAFRPGRLPVHSDIVPSGLGRLRRRTSSTRTRQTDRAEVPEWRCSTPSGSDRQSER